MTGPSGSDLDRLREHIRVVRVWCGQERTGDFAAHRVADAVQSLLDDLRVERECADQLGAERDAYKNDRDWYERTLRDRTLDMRAERARASAAETTLNRIRAEAHHHLNPIIGWWRYLQVHPDSEPLDMASVIEHIEAVLAVLDSKETSHG